MRKKFDILFALLLGFLGIMCLFGVIEHQNIIISALLFAVSDLYLNK